MVPADAEACDHGDRTGSSAVAASGGSAVHWNGHRSSCCQRRGAAGRGQAAGSVRDHPTVDQADLLWYQLADMPAGGRLAAAAHQLGSVVHW